MNFDDADKRFHGHLSIGKHVSSVCNRRRKEDSHNKADGGAEISSSSNCAVFGENGSQVASCR